MIFEWDENKAEKNERKHGVTFDEAESVFYDPRSLTIPDPDHSETELRFIDIGMSNYDRILVVVYTERDDRIRLISARSASRKERKLYE
jgi:uncharacterized DUF497 family protein